ncbi:PaaD-like zinc ribbon domain-containing protein [Paraburkholderia acidicola]
MSLVSRPRYRLGFSPDDQGMSCPRCGAHDTQYFHRFGSTSSWLPFVANTPPSGIGPQTGPIPRC